MLLSAEKDCLPASRSFIQEDGLIFIQGTLPPCATVSSGPKWESCESASDMHTSRLANPPVYLRGSPPLRTWLWGTHRSHNSYAHPVSAWPRCPACTLSPTTPAQAIPLEKPGRHSLLSPSCFCHALKPRISNRTVVPMEATL